MTTLCARRPDRRLLTVGLATMMTLMAVLHVGRSPGHYQSRVATVRQWNTSVGHRSAQLEETPHLNTHRGKRQPSSQQSPADRPRPARILLLGYMRTGSSFTAELLTLHPDFNYLFEPLWPFKKSRRLPGYTTEEMQWSWAGYLAALFDCDPLLTNQALEEKFVDRSRFLLADCRQRHLLAKVIRVRGATLSYLMEMQPELKVIHLVRDPRATASSRSRVGAKDSGAVYCNEIREDLSVTDQLAVIAPGRYTLVRYEDLANKSTIHSELGRLYRFMELPLPDEALEHYLERHYNASSGQRTDRAKLNSYSTVKKQDYDPHSWKKRLTETRIKEIEFQCKDVMERFGYELSQSATS